MRTCMTWWGARFKKGRVAQCHDTGFRGRAGIYEVMEITGEIRRLVHRGAATHEFRSYMETAAMSSLRQEGVKLAVQGRTTLDEVFMSTQQDEEEATPKKIAAAPIAEVLQ